jgi:sulfatase modifying factor 1
MVFVTWADAAGFCGWSGGRLPTEAEWEYAARGGRRDSVYPWGDQEPSCQRGAANGAKFQGGPECGPAGTVPVASYAPNGLGLYDVVGNAWEWCSDFYRPRASDETGGAGEGGGHVVRGGASNSRPRGLRLSLRNQMASSARSVFVGMRCARDVPPS